MLPNKEANASGAVELPPYDDPLPVREAADETMSFQYTQTNNGSALANTNLMSAINKKPSQQSLGGSNFKHGSFVNFELTGASKF